MRALRSLLVGLVGLGLIATTQAPPQWEPASPDRLVTDPCDGVSVGREGLSNAWVKTTLLRLGHPRSSVCGRWSELDPAAYSAFEPDWTRLMAQSTARMVVTYGAPDGRWTNGYEDAARACFAHLSADDYRAWRLYLAQGPAQPCAGT
jgi:hypothetical protein